MNPDYRVGHLGHAAAQRHGPLQGIPKLVRILRKCGSADEQASQCTNEFVPPYLSGDDELPQALSGIISNRI